MPKTIVNLSYCADHLKDQKKIYVEGHYQWLLDAIQMHQKAGWEVTVSCIGTPAKEEPIPVPYKFLPVNPDRDHKGHCVGGCWATRLAIDLAKELGADYLIQCAEDIIPYPNLFRKMVGLLDAGFDYVGGPWGFKGIELNAQCFAVKVPKIDGFHPKDVDPSAPADTEKSMEGVFAKVLVDAGAVMANLGPEFFYFHTHNYHLWKFMAANEYLCKVAAARINPTKFPL